MSEKTSKFSCQINQIDANVAAIDISSNSFYREIHVAD